MKKLLPFCVLLLWACQEQEVSAVAEEKPEETVEPKEKNNSKEGTTLNYDSLLTEIDLRDSTIQFLNNTGTSKKSTDVEKFCASLANDLLSALNDKKEDAFLSHFSKEFSVNWVDVRNQAQIARYTHEDFKKEFKRLMRNDKKLDLKLNSFDFLSSDVKGDLFNATFKISIKETGKDDTRFRNATMSLVGRKKGSYKIANLNVFVFSAQ